MGRDPYRRRVSITRPALAGIIGVIVGGIGVIGAAGGASAATPPPKMTVTGTATCDASTSHWIIQWSIQSDQSEPGAITQITTDPSGAAAGELTGIKIGDGVGTAQGGPVVATQRVPSFYLQWMQLTVQAKWNLYASATGTVSWEGYCGPSIMPTGSVTYQCGHTSLVSLQNPAGGVALPYEIRHGGYISASGTLQPGESKSMVVPSNEIEEVSAWVSLSTSLGSWVDWSQITFGYWRWPEGCLPPGPTAGDRIKPGEGLVGGTAQDRITSPDGRFSLVLQGFDGNLVLYEYGKRALWAAGMNSAAKYLYNTQYSGFVATYDSHNYPYWWAANIDGRPATLVLQNDGNLVYYADQDHAVIWASNTCCHAPAPPQPAAGAHQLNTGQGLVLGQRITSPNGVYSLVLQDFDGNLVLYKDGTKALWAFGMRADSWFVNQPDGNLVAYKSEGGAVWAANTAGKGAGTLMLQDDGNLVLYRNTDHGVLWSTGTYGK